MSANRILTLLVLATLIALSAYGQAQDTATENDAPASEIAALEFRSYELGWARYRNIDAAGNPKLAADPGATFPFMRVNNGYTRLRLRDLEAPDAIADLIAQHEIAYDEAAIAGHCDPNKLAPASSDIFCVPGTSGMEAGQILLVLFHSDTHEIAALTSTIDNKAGGAQRPTPMPAPVATPEPETPQTKTDGCGPYAPGQWIPIDQHDPALGIPISGAHAGTTTYVCEVPAAGSPYLQAHPPADGGGSGSSGAGGGTSGATGTSGGGQGASLNGVSGASGGPERDINAGSGTGGDGKVDVITVPEEPEECPVTFGCDGGDGLE